MLFSLFLPRGCWTCSMGRMGDIHLMTFLCESVVTCKSKCLSEAGFSWGKIIFFFFWPLFEKGTKYIQLEIHIWLQEFLNDWCFSNWERWENGIVQQQMSFFPLNVKHFSFFHMLYHGMGDTIGDYVTNPCFFLFVCTCVLLQKHSEKTADMNRYDQVW